MTKLSIQKEFEAWQRVRSARDPKRPKAMRYIQSLLTDFIELHGDRLSHDDAAIISGIGMLDDIAVTVIAIKKGETMEENIECHFGMPLPSGYRKALRQMKLAEKFGRPIITIVDTSGAYPGFEAETQSQGEAIARNLFELAEIDVPVLSIITGEGGSGGALALAVSDEVWMFENAIYSILSPEGFASILWKDSSRAQEAAARVKMTAAELYEIGMIEQIIYEPKRGITQDFELFVKQLKVQIYDKICELNKMDSASRLERRYQRYRVLGSLNERGENDAT